MTTHALIIHIYIMETDTLSLQHFLKFPGGGVFCDLLPQSLVIYARVCNIRESNKITRIQYFTVATRRVH